MIAFIVNNAYLGLIRQNQIGAYGFESKEQLCDMGGSIAAVKSWAPEKA